MEINKQTTERISEQALTDQLIALRDRVARGTEIMKQMKAEFEKRRLALPQPVSRDEFAVLEARIAKLELSGRARP